MNKKLVSILLLLVLVFSCQPNGGSEEQDNVLNYGESYSSAVPHLDSEENELCQLFISPEDEITKPLCEKYIIILPVGDKWFYDYRKILGNEERTELISTYFESKNEYMGGKKFKMEGWINNNDEKLNFDEEGYTYNNLEKNYFSNIDEFWEPIDLYILRKIDLYILKKFGKRHEEKEENYRLSSENYIKLAKSRAMLFKEFSNFKINELGFLIPSLAFTQPEELIPDSKKIESRSEDCTLLQTEYYFKTINNGMNLDIYDKGLDYGIDEENNYLGFKCGQDISRRYGVVPSKYISFSNDYGIENIGNYGEALNMNGKIAFSSFGHTEKNENNVIVGIVDRVLIFPHELAHLFGVCDEYLFSYWEKQNEDLLLNTNELMGCANPFPNQCLDRIDEKCEGNILPIPYVKGYIDKILGIEGIDFGENICDKNSQVQYSMMGHHGFEHLGSMEMTVISECGFEECSRCSVGNNIEDCIDQTSKVCEKLWT